jgi:hypothetical protein
MNDVTQEILNRFRESFIQAERIYDHFIEGGLESLKPIRLFIEKLRSEGEDRYFRLGTSMHALIISRSVEHGLRADQKSIKIEAYGNNRFEITFKEGTKIYRQFMATGLDDVRLENLLKTLKDTLID